MTHILQAIWNKLFNEQHELIIYDWNYKMMPVAEEVITTLIDIEYNKLIEKGIPHKVASSFLTIMPLMEYKAVKNLQWKFPDRIVETPEEACFIMRQDRRLLESEELQLLTLLRCQNKRTY